MRICVVGGTGNISTSLVSVLVEHGHEVTCFNRGLSGTVPPNVKLIAGDRKFRKDFELIMQEEAFDAAIDMICFNEDDAVSDIKAFRGVSHFIHISTTCTYGVDYDYLPVAEEHPLRPITEYGRNKVKADEVFLKAHQIDGFPVTIVKPSTTYGPKMGLLRQIAWDSSWIDRVRHGRPILICGDGNAIHQFMHVNDAARCIALMIGRQKCIGKTYNMVNPGYTTWEKYHKTAMQVIGNNIDMYGVCCRDLEILGVPDFAICRDIFSHNCYYSSEKLLKDLPEFTHEVSLEKGILNVYESMLANNSITTSPQGGWEDVIIAKIKKLLKS